MQGVFHLKHVFISSWCSLCRFALQVVRCTVATCSLRVSSSCEPNLTFARTSSICTAVVKHETTGWKQQSTLGAKSEQADQVLLFWLHRISTFPPISSRLVPQGVSPTDHVHIVGCVHDSLSPTDIFLLFPCPLPSLQIWPTPTPARTTNGSSYKSVSLYLYGALVKLPTWVMLTAASPK